MKARPLADRLSFSKVPNIVPDILDPQYTFAEKASRD